jgi:signal transduction histidine kinase
VSAQRFTFAVAAAVTVAAGCAAAWAVAFGGNRPPSGQPVELAVTLAVGWSFAGGGLVAWARRPASRVGRLMVLVGLAWFLRSATAVAEPRPYVVGTLGGSLYLGLLAHLIVGYPDGRLGGWADRVVVAAGYALTVPTSAVFLVRSALLGQCWACPAPVPFVERLDPAAYPAYILIVGGISAVLVVLAVRWWRASPPRRRAQAPALLGAVLIMATLLVQRLGEMLGLASAPLAWSTEIVLVLWPLALLVGLLRDRLDRAAVGELVLTLSREAPGPGRVRAALAKALRDESLELVFTLPGETGTVDAEGRAVRLDQTPGRAVTVLVREGEPVAALRYDASVDPDLVRAAGAAAGLALQNERLRAEVLAQLDEVQRSRARILAAADAARRSVERDLHDGAQQRLIGAALALRLARDRLKDAGLPADLDAELATVADEVDAAVRELRELARGLHPTVLADGGLAAALTSLAERSVVPVELTDLPAGRLPEPVEVTCYFVIAEALTNAAKHSDAQLVRVTVRVAVGQDRVTVEVADDGRGGADPAGSGLRGLADRVAALGGRLAVLSPPGGGTRITAELPCV